nr:hypothetical protein BaRGS_029641 [Batillaria attramentaria]
MFADRIPNGQQVPHPCKPNVLWHGVGHFNVDGGGFRNPFGQDFDDAGKQWTESLCRKDSDGDGRTNGEELGDPNCVWKVGQMPTATTGLSHPGVCDPMDSLQCQQKPFHVGLFRNQEEWMAAACKSSEFNCSGIHDSDVTTMTARLDETQVPAKETTYICQIFEFEDLENDYHMIASTPVINNSYILHHMVIFGCEDDVPTKSAYECDMLPDLKCKIILTVWTLGLNGDCFHPSAGVRLGKHGLKKLAVQLHWNNPGLVADYVDSSGLVMHYTPTLRPNDASMFLVGNEHFIIPPRTDKTVVTTKCVESCTRQKLGETIHIYSALNHMHYLGRKMRMEQYRNGSLVRTITDDLIYDYDSPKLYFFPDPIPVEPGDEIRTTCEYSSTYKAVSTYWGESTSDEMCYGFMAFYPAQGMLGEPFCTTYATISSCDPGTYHGCINEEEAKYYQRFQELDVYHNITAACRPFGPCTTECMEAILTARAVEPCLTSGDAWQRIVEWGLTRSSEGRDFLASMESCEIEIHDMVSAKDSISPH